MESKITYFETKGGDNTDLLIKCVKERIEQGGINYVVLASTNGDTGIKLADCLEGTNTKIVCATLHAGFREPGKMVMTDERKHELEQKGVTVFSSSHALSGVNRSISNKFGGTSELEIIGHTLRLFCGHGIKVGVEVSVMATDAGYIPVDEDVIAIGGSSTGADAAIVLRAAHMNNFFDMQIKEIIAKPINN